ncbi:PAS domain S-box protein [Geobacter sp. FeAm09]|uniref:histidine kinase N-terminal 7TM domain-containing protein n=1 Tax=Geobacter sp. FeAm09 TaxID=2597769 RepID=UPI0011EC6E4B|nr:histidine kinase N-terminal 7TM domain-containing protein [Geobacter sp. FeAm09]QEM68999.1 PAS domain S-box protein [Geobacter sp. FeAm09]
MTVLRPLLIGFLLLSAIGDVFLACFAWRRNHLPGAPAFAALMAAVGCYSFGYALELSSDTLEAMLAWSRVQYLGIVLIAPLWIIATLHYSGRGRWLTVPVTAGLFVVPLVILVLRTIPAFSWLVYRGAWINTAAPFPLLAFTPGPWYWVSTTYTNLAMLAGTLLIGVKPRYRSTMYRRQDMVMLVGSLFPWCAFLVYLAGFNPWGIDLVPIALSLAGPLYAWGILSTRLFDLAPVARETLFDRMSEPVLVFDNQGRFVDCNRAAARFGMEDRVGLPVSPALEHLPGLGAVVDGPRDEGDGPLWQDRRDGRFWQVSVSRISEGNDVDRGRLVVLRDVTGLKRVVQALRQSEEQYRFVTENVSDAIWQLDAELRFVFVNGHTDFHGYTREELIGKPLFSLLTPEGVAEVTRKQAERMQMDAQGTASGVLRYEVQMLCKDGGHIWVEVDVTPYRDENDAIIGYVGVTRDISGRREAENAIRKLSTIVEQSPVSIVITDREGTIEYVNPSFCHQTGYGPDEVCGGNPRILKAGEHPPEFYVDLWRRIQGGEVWRGEFHNRKKNGELFWESASISPIRDGLGVITHYVAVKEDITEKKLLVERLQQMAHYDELTGLPNRTLFFDRFRQAAALAARDRHRFALLYLDLDGFKEINDAHGHETGDHVLKIVADRLTSCVRGSDTVARMGGDEFTLILATLSQGKDAGQVAEHIIGALSQPLVVPDGSPVRLGASIGIGVFPDDADSAEKLLICADVAMYRAKRSGKNTYCFGRDDTAGDHLKQEA